MGVHHKKNEIKTQNSKNLKLDIVDLSLKIQDISF